MYKRKRSFFARSALPENNSSCIGLYHGQYNKKQRIGYGTKPLNIISTNSNIDTHQVSIHGSSSKNRSDDMEIVNDLRYKAVNKTNHNTLLITDDIKKLKNRKFAQERLKMKISSIEEFKISASIDFKNILIKMKRIRMSDLNMFFSIGNIDNIMIAVKQIIPREYNRSHNGLNSYPLSNNSRFAIEPTGQDFKFAHGNQGRSQARFNWANDPQGSIKSKSVRTNVKSFKIFGISKCNGNLFSWEGIKFRALLDLKCYYTTFCALFNKRSTSDVFKNIQSLDITFLKARKNDTTVLINSLDNLKNLTIKGKAWTSDDISIDSASIENIHLIGNTFNYFSAHNLPNIRSISIEDSTINSGSLDLPLFSAKGTLLVKLKKCKYKFKQGKVYARGWTRNSSKSINNNSSAKMTEKSVRSILETSKSNRRASDRVKNITLKVSESSLLDILRYAHLNLKKKAEVNLTIEYDSPRVNPRDIEDHFIKREMTRALLKEKYTISASYMHSKIFNTISIPKLKLLNHC